MQSAQSLRPDQKLTAGLYTTHAHIMIASSKRAELATQAHGSWIVHSHYRGTVESKYVDIAISFAQPSQDSQLDQF